MSLLLRVPCSPAEVRLVPRIFLLTPSRAGWTNSCAHTVGPVTQGHVAERHHHWVFFEILWFKRPKLTWRLNQWIGSLIASYQRGDKLHILGHGTKVCEPLRADLLEMCWKTLCSTERSQSGYGPGCCAYLTWSPQQITSKSTSGFCLGWFSA